MRPIENEALNPGIAADVNMLLRDVPDHNGVVRPYVENIMKNVQVLQRESSGAPLHYKQLVDLTTQYALRDPRFSVTDYENAAFIFQTIGDKFVDRSPVVEEFIRQHTAARHAGGIVPGADYGRSRAD